MARLEGLEAVSGRGCFGSDSRIVFLFFPKVACRLSIEVLGFVCVLEQGLREFNIEWKHELASILNCQI